MPITTGSEPKALMGGSGMAGKRWMQPEGKGSTIVKHPGALREALHVPKGENIPEAKLEHAEHSSNPTMRHRAALAEVFKHAHHSGEGAAHHSGSGPAHR